MPRNPQQLEFDNEIETDRAELASEQRQANVASTSVTRDPSLEKRGVPAAFGNPDDITPDQAQDAFIRDFNSKIVAISDPLNPAGTAQLNELHQKAKDTTMQLARAAQSDPLRFPPAAASPTPDFNPADVPQPHMEHPALPTPHTVPFNAKVR